MAEGNGITVLSIPSVDPDREPGSGPYPVQFTIQNANNHGVAVYVSCETTGPLTCANVSWTSGVVPKKGSQQVSLTYSTTSGSGQGSVKLIVELDVGTPPMSWGARSVLVMPPGKSVPLAAAFTGNVDRGLCLTVGAGEGGGLSCGDLFLVEGLPA